jgi:hypothetical protein
MSFLVSSVDLGPQARRSFKGRRDTKSRWQEELYETPSFAFDFELVFGRDRLRKSPWEGRLLIPRWTKSESTSDNLKKKGEERYAISITDL